jgi:hypothetical protein
MYRGSPRFYWFCVRITLYDGVIKGGISYLVDIIKPVKFMFIHFSLPYSNSEKTVNFPAHPNLKAENENSKKLSLYESETVTLFLRAYK